jgi:hypothetical protein
MDLNQTERECHVEEPPDEQARCIQRMAMGFVVIVDSFHVDGEQKRWLPVGKKKHRQMRPCDWQVLFLPVIIVPWICEESNILQNMFEKNKTRSTGVFFVLCVLTVSSSQHYYIIGSNIQNSKTHRFCR